MHISRRLALALLSFAALACFIYAATVIRLTTQVVGILPLANGGTAASSLPAIGGARLAWCIGTIGTGNGTTYFLAPAATATSACTATTGTETPTPIACTAKNLYAKVRTAGSAAGSGVITLNKGGVATAVTCTMGTATSCSDLTHTVSFSAGDNWSVTETTGQATDTSLDTKVSFLCN